MQLIQPMLNSFPPQAWGALAGSLNETPERARQGLFDAVPMFFASLIGKASTTAGAASLLSLMRNSPIDLNNVASSRPGAVTDPNVLREGDSLAHSILGDSFNNVANTISRHAGVGLNSAQSLLGLAAPLALGGIAKAAPPSGFTPEGLMRFLQGQRDDVIAAAPQDLPLGLDRAPTASATVHAAATAPPIRRGGGVMPWILGIGAAILLALILGQCMSRTPAPVVETPSVTVPAAPAAPVVTPNIIELPGGVRLDVPVGSIGHNLATYLASAQPAPQTFTFDNLNFDTAEVTVTPESTATLNAIAQTLTAYPNAQVRLEGHTDTVGERQANIDLSLARANAVARSLSDRGVDASRITAAGFGPDRPVASNDTEAGRAQNRRLELTITQK